MKKLLAIGIIAVSGLAWWQMNREVEVVKNPIEQAAYEKRIEELKQEITSNPESPASVKIERKNDTFSGATETKPKVEAPKEKPLGAIYKFNTLSGENPYGSWKDAKTGEQRFYDKNGKFYTNTQEILDMQKPKLRTATST